MLNPAHADVQLEFLVTRPCPGYKALGVRIHRLPWVLRLKARARTSRSSEGIGRIDVDRTGTAVVHRWRCPAVIRAEHLPCAKRWGR